MQTTAQTTTALLRVLDAHALFYDQTRVLLRIPHPLSRSRPFFQCKWFSSLNGVMFISNGIMFVSIDVSAKNSGMASKIAFTNRPLPLVPNNRPPRSFSTRTLSDNFMSD